MENETNTKSDYENIFKIDYDNQNLDNNIEYKNWKNIMKKKFGKNGKLFKCIKDKILFYDNYENYKNLSVYKTRCPKCDKYICHFCSYSEKKSNELCCLKGAIMKSFFDYGLQYINEKNGHIKKISDDYSALFTILPGINLFLICFIITNITYFNLITKESLLDENKERLLYLLLINYL